MKVTITHLKAPWPEGAGVGSVVDVGDSLPAWAVGKCTPAADDQEQAKAEPESEPKAEKAAKGKQA